MPSNNLVDHFRPGNIVYSGYWRRFDLVLAFHPITQEKKGWTVDVIECDGNGTPLRDAKRRNHCTTPDYLRDRVVGTTEVAHEVHPSAHPAQ